MIVNNYNYIINGLLIVEEPLVSAKITNMEKEITPGIEEYKWKSDKINDFIGKSKKTVDTLFDTVNKMKDNYKKIKDALCEFNKNVIEKKNKPLSPE